MGKTKSNGEGRDIVELRADVLRIRGALQDFLVERDEAIEALLCAFVLQEHVVFFGPPGTAKSLAVESLLSCIDGRYVRRLLHKFMTPDELIGPMDLKEFQDNRRYRRVLAGGAADCEGLFLDEVFDANSALLRSLLTLLNERTFEDQSGRIDVPLRLCAGATNFHPEDNQLAALYDRFLFRHEERYIAERGNLKALLCRDAGRAKKDQHFVPPCQLTVEEWDRITADVEQVTISEGIVDKLIDFRDLLGQEGIVLSDRRLKQLLRAAKAAAWLDGETDVDVEHLQILRFCAWSSATEREKVLALVKTLERSEVAEVIEQIDEALRAFNDRPRDAVRAAQELPKLLSQIRTVSLGIKERIEAGEFSVRGADKIKHRCRELSEAHNQLTQEFASAVRI